MGKRGKGERSVRQPVPVSNTVPADQEQALEARIEVVAGITVVIQPARHPLTGEVIKDPLTGEVVKEKSAYIVDRDQCRLVEYLQHPARAVAFIELRQMQRAMKETLPSGERVYIHADRLNPAMEALVAVGCVEQGERDGHTGYRLHDDLVHAVLPDEEWQRRSEYAARWLAEVGPLVQVSGKMNSLHYQLVRAAYREHHKMVADLSEAIRKGARVMNEGADDDEEDRRIDASRKTGRRWAARDRGLSSEEHEKLEALEGQVQELREQVRQLEERAVLDSRVPVSNMPISTGPTKAPTATAKRKRVTSWNPLRTQPATRRARK